MKVIGDKHFSANHKILFFIIPLIVARGYVTGLNSDSFAPEDALPVLRGILSDITAGALAGFAVQFLHRVRGTFFAIWTLWIMAFSLNIEHIKVNSSNVNYEFLHLALAREFIFGSVLSIKNLLNFIICFSLSLILVSISLRYRLQVKSYLKLIAITSLLIITILVPTIKVYPYWVQMNFLEENARNIFSRMGKSFKSEVPSKEVTEHLLSLNLQGEPIVQYNGAKPNVLLILIEGAGYQASGSDKMPLLRRLAEASLSYENFIGLQRQTNRGLYAIICGDYPNYVTREAKSDYMEYLTPTKPCLPNILRKNGYRTVFMQSAPLGYMQKDNFSKSAGFEESIGSGQYKKFRKQTRWGIDDDSLYKHAFRKIKELSKNSEPFFLTLLTSGTHHPYNVPGKVSPNMDDAFSYADASLYAFIDVLTNSAYFNNTLVLITSDESLLSYGEGILNELSRHHLPLIVLLPHEERRMTHDGLFSQLDIMLSIIDYLGLDFEKSFGRSIFRSYKDGRSLVFSNVYSSKIYMYTQDEKLYLCSEEIDCSAYENTNNLIFDSSYVLTESDPKDIELLKSFLATNEFSSDKITTTYLLRDKNRDLTGSRYLVGDLKTSLNINDKMIWKYKIKTEDPLTIFYYAVIPNKDTGFAGFERIFWEKVNIGSNETFIFEHELVAKKNIPVIWTKLQAIAGTDSKYRVDEIGIQRFKARK
jgi:arylsulfatase A-like enzyme